MIEKKQELSKKDKYLLIILIISFLSIIIFHFLVLFGFIKSNIVWWWNIQTKQQIYILETVSIFVNLLILGAFLINFWYLTQNKIAKKISKISIWIIFIIFSLNTLWNLFSKNEFEKLFFTPITFILAIISFYLATKKQ